MPGKQPAKEPTKRAAATKTQPQASLDQVCDDMGRKNNNEPMFHEDFISTPKIDLGAFDSLVSNTGRRVQ
jgi:hypothetical protein